VVESPSALPVERVLLVDPSDAFRAGLRQAFGAGHGRPVLEVAGTASEATALAAWLRPDAAVVDADLPDQSGIALCRAQGAAAPGVAVVVLSQADWDVYLAGAWAAGAAWTGPPGRGNAEHVALAAGDDRPVRAEELRPVDVATPYSPLAPHGPSPAAGHPLRQAVPIGHRSC